MGPRERDGWFAVLLVLGVFLTGALYGAHAPSLSISLGCILLGFIIWNVTGAKDLDRKTRIILTAIVSIMLAVSIAIDGSKIWPWWQSL